MLLIRLVNLEDFKLLVKKEKTVFRKAEKKGNLYYIFSETNEIPTLFSYFTDEPLEFSFSFEFGEEKITVESLIDIIDISFI